VTDPQEVIELASGQIQLWIEERRVVCLKIKAAEGEPIRLPAHDLNELIRELRILKSRLD